MPTIGATATLALDANQYRVKATFVNDSNETIYLAKSEGAAMNSGIRLNANGGSFEDLPTMVTINGRTFAYIYKGAYTAICASGGKVLTVQEESLA